MWTIQHYFYCFLCLLTLILERKSLWKALDGQIKEFKKKIKQKRRCSWKCHKDWCYPNKKYCSPRIFFIALLSHLIDCIITACERKKLPIELRQMLTLTPICDVNLTHRELRNCFSPHLPPTTSSLSYVKKKKKEWKLRWYSYQKTLILKYTTWLCLYDWNEVGQETKKTNLFSATCKLCLFTVGRRTKSEHNKILPWYSVSTEALFILIHKMMKQPRLYP